MDTAAWIDNFKSVAMRLEASIGLQQPFEFAVEPPASEDYMASVIASLDCPVPLLLQQLYTKGSTEFSMYCHVLRNDREGEPEMFEENSSFRGFCSWFCLLPPSRLKEECEMMRESAEELESMYGADHEFSELAPFLRTTLPFMISGGTGNRFVLHVGEDPIDPAVYWWIPNEIDGVMLLDFSLKNFLTQWEKLRYVNEDGWPLLNYVNAEIGLVVSEEDTAQIDRYLFE